MKTPRYQITTLFRSSIVKLIHTTVVAAVFIGATAPSYVSGAGLRLWGIFNLQFNEVWELDPGTAAASGAVVQDTDANVAEFEFGMGAYFAASTDQGEELFVLHPSTGALLNTITMTLPTGGNVITSMEFIGNTLYAGFATERAPNTDSSLVTIDTTTGVVSPIGAMGVGTPTGGLAYDGTTLYTVNAGGNNATLYTLDLGTGAAQSVGPVLDSTGAPVGLTGLEFGNDGVLYGLGRKGIMEPNELYTINPATGAATGLGLVTGTSDNNQSITTIPELSSLLLCLIGLALAGVRRRLP